MVDYEKLYKVLFNGITDAIEDLDEHNYGLAKDRLINVQQEVEDSYMRSEE